MILNNFYQDLEPRMHRYSSYVAWGMIKLLTNVVEVNPLLIAFLGQKQPAAQHCMLDCKAREREKLAGNAKCTEVIPMNKE